jgi:hypothetical protein
MLAWTIAGLYLVGPIAFRHKVRYIGWAGGVPNTNLGPDHEREGTALMAKEAVPSSTVPRNQSSQKKPLVAVRFREGIAARRANYQIAEYAANALADFPIEIEDLGLLLPERVALEQLMGARARRVAERAVGELR